MTFQGITKEEKAIRGIVYELSEFDKILESDIKWLIEIEKAKISEKFNIRLLQITAGKIAEKALQNKGFVDIFFKIICFKRNTFKKLTRLNVNTLTNTHENRNLVRLKSILKHFLVRDTIRKVRTRKRLEKANKQN